MAFQVEFFQHFDLAPAEVYDIFSRVTNLSKFLPGGVSLELLSEPHLELVPGMMFDYNLRQFGVPISWRTLITEVDAPRAFADIQVRGPYKSFCHSHQFRDVGHGTLMVDRIDYELWGGPFAPIINALYVRPMLHRIFHHRAKVAETMDRKPAKV
jgi:ligand-binding SRPBCC domain-containing protein